jgi:lipopolysaccharide/colanic/teichoic acid biosynthesis glycosyltransferase
MGYNPNNCDPISNSESLKGNESSLFCGKSFAIGLPGNDWSKSGDGLKIIAVDSRRSGPRVSLGQSRTIQLLKLWHVIAGIGADDRRRLSKTALRYLIAKRAIDIAFALIALVFTGPLLLLCAGVVKLVSPGPAFIRVERFGRNEKPIRMFKLRTMHVDAEDLLKVHLRNNPNLVDEWRQSFKLREDPRLIPWVGSFLRKSSIDELPQLINVLRGDMSLVGPRPLPAYHLAAFEPEFRALRASVAPGLTGLWQVECRNTGGLRELVFWDSKYVTQQSIRVDVTILCKTISAVISGDGAY